MRSRLQPAIRDEGLRNARRAELAAAYDAHERKAKAARLPLTLAGRRVREMGRLFFYRYGPFLPDDDAGRDDLWLVAQHIRNIPGDVVKMITDWTSLWAPWMSPEEAERFAKGILDTPRVFFKADELAERLGLTASKRTELRFKTIGAIDFLKTERVALRKERDCKAARERRARKAMAAGRTPGVNGRPRKNPSAVYIDLTNTDDGFSTSRTPSLREDGRNLNDVSGGKSSACDYLFNNDEIEGIDMLITAELADSRIHDGSMLLLSMDAPASWQGVESVVVRRRGEAIAELEAVDNRGTFSWYRQVGMNFHIQLEHLGGSFARVNLSEAHRVIIAAQDKAAAIGRH